MQRKSSNGRELRKPLYGKHAGESICRTVHATHDTVVGHCDYCGRPMNASERNDYGSLCQTCYMKEYYGR